MTPLVSGDILVRRLLCLAAAALIALGLAACGGAKDTAATSAAHTDAGSNGHPVSTIPTDTAPTPVKAAVDTDQDNDVGAPQDDTNNSRVLYEGHAASAADQRAIVALVKRYYAAALAQDGAKACAMIYSTLAEAIPEDYGKSPPGPPYMRGTTCPVIMTLLFKHERLQLAAELPKLKVLHVRLIEHSGNVVLGFGRMPERQIPVHREGSVWKIDSLLDTELP